MDFFERFMGGCLKSEIELPHRPSSIAKAGNMQEATHPDAIKGKWRAAAERVSEQQVARILGL